MTRPNFWLVCSSQFFLIPSILAYNISQYTISCTYTLLWFTSSLYHMRKCRTTFYMDQIAVWMAVALSVVSGYNTYPTGMVCTLLGNGYNYYTYFHYMVRATDKRATLSHVGIHVITSVATVCQISLIYQYHHNEGYEHQGKCNISGSNG